MKEVIARLVLAALGLMGAALFAVTWFDLPRFTRLLGPEAPTALAAASLRADAGGFFAAWATGALLAAINRDRRWAVLPLLMLGFAFAGRLFTYVQTPDAAIVSPMVTEAVLFVIVWLARQGLPIRA